MLHLLLIFSSLLHLSNGQGLLRASSSGGGGSAESSRMLQNEEFCASGFVMDKFCIERGKLFDNPFVESLSTRGPSSHSIHCLVDVGVCIRSGYEMLREPTSNGGKYEREIEFDDAGNAMVLAEARRVGSSCSTCTGEGNQRSGFFATAVGVISNSGGNNPPRLITRKLVSGEVDCDTLRQDQSPSSSTSATLPPRSSAPVSPAPVSPAPVSPDGDGGGGGDGDGGDGDGGDGDGGGNDGGDGGDGDGGGDDSGAFQICFSGENTVEVLGRGSVRMDTVTIGDSVRVRGGKFAKVYSFGHYEKNIRSNYLQIGNAGSKTPLELSADHMVFVVNNNDETKSVPASNVKVGDTLATLTGGSSKVVFIKHVQRNGAYAPFTTSGDIVVSGVVASNYVSLLDQMPKMMQWIAHTFKAPHRVLCSINFTICENETYINGLSSWIYVPYHAIQFFKRARQNMLSPIVPCLAAGLFLIFGKQKTKVL